MNTEDIRKQKDIDNFIFHHREWKKKYNFCKRHGYTLPDTVKLHIAAQKLNILYGIAPEYYAIIQEKLKLKNKPILKPSNER